MNQAFDFVRDIVAGHYDLGQVVSAERIEKGYFNVSYDLTTRRDGRNTRYVLRRYRLGTGLDRIRFEHELMGELERRGFGLSPVLVPAAAGGTHVEIDEPAPDGGRRPVYLALFSFLEGEEPYDWVHSGFAEAELADAASVLAAYHRTLYGWTPNQPWRGPRITDKMATLDAMWPAPRRGPGRTVFDEHYHRHRPELLDIAAASAAALQRQSHDSLPHMAIHGDFHPGNLKYGRGRVSGLFDFDWANVDSRCFDVALAVTYFCAVWGDEDGGVLDLDNVGHFLKAYRGESSGESEPPRFGPLEVSEVACMMDLIRAANLYIATWTVDDYHISPQDAEVYLGYLRHGTRLARWLETHRRELSEVVDESSLGGRA